MSKSPVVPHRGRLLDARLHLLDRQLLDHTDAPVGIVDDLEITDIDIDRDIRSGTEAPQVTGVLSGQVVTTRIFGGTPPPSHLQAIPWELVACIAVVVTLKPTDMTFDAGWVERWLRERIIKHIPGGRHAAE
jgi:hypothetical protein